MSYIFDPNWFPRAGVSLLGGPSGSGKSTWMLAALTAQANGDPFLGHSSFRLPFLVVAGDRLDDDAVNVDPFSSTRLEQINKAVEAEAPAILFIEGLDIFTALQPRSFASGLQRLAVQHNLAVIGSVGSLRGHKAETLVQFEITNDVARRITVLPRAGKAEVFNMEFNSKGILAIQ